MNIDPNYFQLLVITKALEVYLKTGMQVNTSYTLKNMLKFATSKTGKEYKRSTAPEALEDLLSMIKTKIGK